MIPTRQTFFTLDASRVDNGGKLVETTRHGCRQYVWYKWQVDGAAERHIVWYNVDNPSSMPSSKEWNASVPTICGVERMGQIVPGTRLL